MRLLTRSHIDSGQDSLDPERDSVTRAYTLRRTRGSGGFAA